VVGFILTTVACSNESKPAVSKQETPSLVPAATPPATPVQVAVQPPAVKKPVRRHVAKVVTYSDPTYGVSFQYPRKYSLKVGEQAKAATTPAAMDFIQPGGVNVVAVEMPRTSYPGTDFGSAFFNVSVHKEMTEAQCSQFTFGKYVEEGKINVAKEKVGALEFGMVEDGGGKVSEQTNAKYYHLYDSGACYEFVLGLGTVQHETADDLKLVDRDAVFNQLEKILATVKITPVKTPEVAATTATEPVADKTNQ